MNIMGVMFFNKIRRCNQDENDISAKEEIKKQSSWFQKQNEYTRRKKSFSC